MRMGESASAYSPPLSYPISPFCLILGLQRNRKLLVVENQVSE